MNKFYLVFIAIILLAGYIQPKENPLKNINSSDPAVLKPNDTKSDLVALLNNLISNSDVDLFKTHCSSIIDVISSRSNFRESELVFLEDMYKTFSDTSLKWNACKLSTYTERKRPFIISWKSPTDDEVSVAWLLLPERWDPGKTYPLYVSLHGLYQPYNDEIEYMTRYFKPDSLTNKSFEDGYTLFPWGRGNMWYEGISELDVLESIDAVEHLVRVNKNRKYLMGHSMGGYGTWCIAAMDPEPWAAIGIMAGALGYNYLCLSSIYAEMLSNTPVYIVVGDYDGLYNYNLTAFNLLQKAGNPNIEFVTFQGGHESLLENWVNMYNWIRNFSKDSLTSVSSIASPDQYVLYNNYPNPFNPATTISYYIPEAANVKIEIYNLLGQKIATLTDGLATTGNYKINWDAQNLSGGVYFCKLYAAPVSFSKITNHKVFEKTQKLLLLK